MALKRVESIPRLLKRSPDGHKGNYGSILIIAGGRGMAGAAALCGASALRSGSGLVRVACPAEVQPTVASFEPSYMTYPLPCDGEGLVDFAASRPVLEKLVQKADVVAVGPGLGESDDVLELVRWAVESAGKPLVLDADALNALAKDVGLVDRLETPTVVTPHPGEFARLTGMTTKLAKAEREPRSAAFAARNANLVVVLKGGGTLVTDGDRVYVNTTGNPGMATGGAGDVLTGVVAAMLGQKLAAFEAAQLAVYAHGLAGDIARDDSGEVGLIAGDIADALPDAFHHGVREQEIDEEEDDVE
ncbi:NAD(P)H-hydrate dehydratase [Paludisphaera mucosa]|uniref:ADP-dependent (S)-NAD(P)H-hydrate dehydratase n=1 Tax=Paludisphaera mucosa TaxID=3030827 RepID=A0ABT6FF50_9BACT|nr:NAD(P)H-hydrate dehydratase [Paludisphaera mucosa]MDG3006196.1 NAD(P)H-hydrate dehydratase [Paludisphaera mucosa]